MLAFRFPTERLVCSGCARQQPPSAAASCNKLLGSCTHRGSSVELVHSFRSFRGRACICGMSSSGRPRMKASRRITGTGDHGRRRRFKDSTARKHNSPMRGCTDKTLQTLRLATPPTVAEWLHVEVHNKTSRATSRRISSQRRLGLAVVQKCLHECNPKHSAQSATISPSQLKNTERSPQSFKHKPIGTAELHESCTIEERRRKTRQPRFVCLPKTRLYRQIHWVL